MAPTERPTRRCASTSKTSSQAGKTRNHPTRKSPSLSCTAAAGGDTSLGPSKRRGRPRKGAQGASASPSVAPKVTAQKPENMVEIPDLRVCRDPRKANKSGILAMSRKAWRQSLQKACRHTFSRLKLCSGQHKADEIIRRAQAGLEGGGAKSAKSVPVTKLTKLKRPCCKGVHVPRRLVLARAYRPSFPYHPTCLVRLPTLAAAGPPWSPLPRAVRMHGLQTM